MIRETLYPKKKKKLWPKTDKKTDIRRLIGKNLYIFADRYNCHDEYFPFSVDD